MKTSKSSANDSTSVFSTALQHSASLFSARRLSYTVAGAFVLVGAAAALNGTTDTPHSSAKNQSLTVNALSTPDSATGQPAQDNSQSGATNTTKLTTRTSSGNTEVHLNVNGQDIPVPADTNSTQTITNSTGTTTVNVQNNTATDGSATNSSTTNFSLDVQSSSSTTGGTTTP